MDTLFQLYGGFLIALEPQNLALALLGAFLGTLFGALPGLGPANGVAILIPLAFAMDLQASSALIFLVNIYYGAMFGGRISSILLNIPGDEPAMMTVLDGYPMAKAGRAGEALAITAIASFVGATVATIGLTLLAPALVQFALLFGSAEYFLLYVLAFALLGGLATGHVVKTWIATLIGLVISTVGLDLHTGVPRFTFNEMKLFEGVDPIVAIIGFFAISEVLWLLRSQGTGSTFKAKVGKTVVGLAVLRRTFFTMIRSSFIGFVCGVLPGAGATLGSFAAYSLERKWVDKEGTFGTGDPRGVAAPEAGNNAAAGGALVPMLALGIPGSGTTAVLLGVLISLNVTPGPLLFTQRPDVAWGLIAALYMSNVVLLVLNLPLVGIFVRLLSVPVQLLLPIVALICFVGVYAISHSVFDIYMMIAMGTFAYFLRLVDIPLVPIVLGILLGGDMETNLRRAISLSNGDWSILFGSPVALTLWALIVLMAVLPMIMERFKSKRVLPAANED
ncbi:tripartite tricarboxylate transporter permease [Silicimonas algicola]|uniref:Putative tricarboxylic transport membrane protein n=1 Tax=Silicimonas algicola TaxID=1826607 RepID=A0A316FXW4_9RHOB|nr:tripartite tricarboxylate transporter permease [Silicimonas algicola]AZQ68326.1 tripartite tricarboxylate transporter permease [Silicimonas algicola]PWK53604.1 putative tricarboxylic transport membrane protein [Silicimonas algicola]